MTASGMHVYNAPFTPLSCRPNGTCGVSPGYVIDEEGMFAEQAQGVSAKYLRISSNKTVTDPLGPPFN